MSILALIIAYLLGSIPFGRLLTRAGGTGDALRAGDKKLVVAMLLLDAAKGLLAVVLARHLTGDPWAGMAAGVLAVTGQMFPVWLKFEGGKGVATTIGALTGLAPWLGFIVIMLWLGIFRVTRLPSLAALVSIGAAPILSMIAGNTLLLFASLSMGTLVFWRHKDNIERLRTGTEIPFDIPPPS